MNKKFLILLWGAPAAGKSTLALKFVSHYRSAGRQTNSSEGLPNGPERSASPGQAPPYSEHNLPTDVPSDHRQLTYLSSDAVSRTLFGDAFVGSMRPAIYETISLLAKRALAANLPVIVDGTYLNREAREQLRQLAEEQGATFLSYLVHCPLELRQQRNSLRVEHERVPSNWVRKAHWAADFQKREAHLVLETSSSDSQNLVQIGTRFAERRLLRVGSIQPKSTPKPTLIRQAALNPLPT